MDRDVFSIGPGGGNLHSPLEAVFDAVLDCLHQPAQNEGARKTVGSAAEIDVLLAGKSDSQLEDLRSRCRRRILKADSAEIHANGMEAKLVSPLPDSRPAFTRVGGLGQAFFEVKQAGLGIDDPAEAPIEEKPPGYLELCVFQAADAYPGGSAKDHHDQAAELIVRGADQQ